VPVVVLAGRRSGPIAVVEPGGELDGAAVVGVVVGVDDVVVVGGLVVGGRVVAGLPPPLP
jgi:hypothetical protein